MVWKPVVGETIESQTWFVVYNDPHYLFSARAKSQETKLKMVRGNASFVVLEGPIQVPVWLFEGQEYIVAVTPKVPMWRVRVNDVSENEMWWEPSIGGEDVEGWVTSDAFTEENIDVIV